MATLFRNLINKWTGKDITDAQREVNAFNAQEAQKARDFEEQMSNTANQRAVADMQAAGLNPALMYEGAGAASTPNGAAASAGADPTGGLSFSDLISTLMAPLGVVQNIEQIKGISKDNELKQKEIDWYDRNMSGRTGEAFANIAKTMQDIENLKVDKAQKEEVLKYFGRLQEAEIRVKNATADNLAKQGEEISKRIEKMDYEECSIFIGMCEAVERIQYLQSQERVNDATVRELNALTNKLNKDAQLLGLNIDNFDDITVVGSSTISGRGPLGIGGSETRPITLGELKNQAQKAKDRQEKTKGKDWKEQKEKASAEYGALE